MYAADVADIGEGATYTTDSAAIVVQGLEYATLWLKATGANASSSGTVTFNIVASGDGSLWSTAGTPYTLTLNANTAVVSEPVGLDLRGIYSLKVTSIVNGDATYHIGAVNAYLCCVKR